MHIVWGLSYLASMLVKRQLTLNDIKFDCLKPLFSRCKMQAFSAKLDCLVFECLLRGL